MSAFASTTLQNSYHQLVTPYNICTTLHQATARTHHKRLVVSQATHLPVICWLLCYLTAVLFGLQVVTCSGVFRDGSLRVVRNGIGINELASIELQGIKGVWSLRSSWMDAYDKYLVLSFVGETRVLAIADDNALDEAEIAGFDANRQSILCANTLYDQLLQVR